MIDQLTAIHQHQSPGMFGGIKDNHVVKTYLTNTLNQCQLGTTISTVPY